MVFNSSCDHFYQQKDFQVPRSSCSTNLWQVSNITLVLCSNIMELGALPKIYTRSMKIFRDFCNVQLKIFSVLVKPNCGPRNNTLNQVLSRWLDISFVLGLVRIVLVKRSAARICSADFSHKSHLVTRVILTSLPELNGFEYLFTNSGLNKRIK